MRKIIIAIDGYSATGKSTFAKKIAAKLKYIFIDTGAMYRAITFYAMKNGLIGGDGIIDRNTLIKKLPLIEISFKYNPGRGASDIYLDGGNIEEEIRTLDVSDNVSAISQIPEVREYLVGIQQKLGEEKGIVIDGRDIGTVVFPEAELKIFMTADPEVRAMRRFRELSEKGIKASLPEILENLRKRDKADTSRRISPLKRAKDALLLDNTNISVEQQMAWVMEKIDKLVQ